MSNKALNWAWEQPVAPAGRKFVLVALADFADEAHSCYPGQELLASMTGQSVSSVARHLDVLEADGVLHRERRFDARGHRTSDRYVLAVGGAESLPVKTPSRHSEPVPTRQSAPSLPVTLGLPTLQIAGGTLSEPPENPQVGAAARRRQPETTIPEGFHPTDSHRSYAAEHGLDLASELMKFRTHAIANDRRLRRWDAGFSMWLQKAKEMRPAAPAGRSAWERATRVGDGW